MTTRFSIHPTSAFVAGAVMALLLGTGTAYAANGGIFRLGRSNSATAATALSNSRGTALKLSSTAGHPSLKVNRTAKVSHLNADLLDGVSSTRFARATTVGSVFGTGFVDDGGTADTSDDAVVAEAVCPTGSQVVGGGGGDFTDDGVLFYSAPDGGDAWLVVSSTADLTAANAANVQAYARCWNPHADLTSNQLRSQKQPQHALTAAGRRAVSSAASKN